MAFEEVKVTQEMESGQWPCGDLPEFSREFPEYRFQKICSKNVQVAMLTAPSAVVGVRGRGRGGCTQSSVSAGCESSPPAIKSDRLSCGLSWVTPDGLGSLGTCWAGATGGSALVRAGGPAVSVWENRCCSFGHNVGTGGMSSVDKGQTAAPHGFHDKLFFSSLI